MSEMVGKGKEKNIFTTSNTACPLLIFNIHLKLLNPRMSLEKIQQLHR